MSTPRLATGRLGAVLGTCRDPAWWDWVGRRKNHAHAATDHRRGGPAQRRRQPAGPVHRPVPGVPGRRAPAASVVDPTTDVDVPGWAADTRVLTVVSTCSLATADAWPALQLSPRQPDDRVILVRVDDCEMHGLGPSRWVDLAGRTEGAARQALLQGVAGQQPAEDHASGQRFGSPLELWLQRLGGELGSPTDSLLLSLCVLTHPDQDHLKAGTPVRGLAELHAPSERGEEPWVPRLMRETLRDRLSPETRDRCADLAADLAGLAEVNAKLSSFAKARFYSVQASAILALVRGQEEPSPEPPAGRPGSCRSPSCRPWREIAGCS